LERKLVRVLGRKEIAGRPLIYATTRKFLETFDLKDLKDLPTPKEIEEFGKAPLEMRGNIAIEPDEEPAALDTGATPSEEPADEPRTEADAEPPAVDAIEETAAPAPPASGDEPPEKKLDFEEGTT